MIRWVTGMQTVSGKLVAAVSEGRIGYLSTSAVDTCTLAEFEDEEPDYTDPGTCGHIMAQLREKHVDLVTVANYDDVGDVCDWSVEYSLRWGTRTVTEGHDTEGQAIRAAVAASPLPREKGTVHTWADG